jgi:hypothetical protein
VRKSPAFIHRGCYFSFSATYLTRSLKVQFCAFYDIKGQRNRYISGFILRVFPRINANGRLVDTTGRSGVSSAWKQGNEEKQLFFPGLFLLIRLFGSPFGYCSHLLTSLQFWGKFVPSNNPTMLSQLVYVSQRKANCTDQEIERILAACKKNNASLDITGVLLYSPAKFIQYLEGNSKEILGLYEKIKGDPRHEKAVMVSYGPIKERLFPSWQMATKSMAQLNVDFRTDVSQQDREIFRRLLNGDAQSGSRAHELLKKFFQ